MPVLTGVDFNRRDADGRLRLGTGTHRVLRGPLALGGVVVLEDHDGNRCEGVLEEGPPGGGPRFRLDLGTWRDGGEVVRP